MTLFFNSCKVFHWMDILNFINNFLLLLDTCLLQKFTILNNYILILAYLFTCFLIIYSYKWILKYFGLKNETINTWEKVCTEYILYPILITVMKGWGFPQVTQCDVPCFRKQLLSKREEHCTPKKKIHVWKHSSLCWQNINQFYKDEHVAHILLLEFNRKNKFGCHLTLNFLSRDNTRKVSLYHK